MDNMKRWIAAEFAPTNTGLKNNVPFDVRLDRTKVLDIYRAHIQINFTVSVNEVVQILAGIKMLDLQKIAAGFSFTSFDEEIQRRTWLCVHHIRYQAPAEAITEEATFDFVTPFTVWASPVLQYMYTGANTDFSNIWCEIQGRLRLPSKPELEQLMLEQRQQKESTNP